jgi:hypothetical protein
MKVLSILIAAGLLAGAYFTFSGSQTDELENAFGAFTAQHNKEYLSEEEYSFRKTIFEKNLKKVNEHNAKGKSSKMGINQFSDWTHEEYKKLLGFKSNRNNAEAFKSLGDLPTNCKNKHSHACNGGLMFNAFNHWMRKNPRTESQYPYEMSKHQCIEDHIHSTIPVLKWGYRVDITYECLYEALTHGPVSVAIRAENDPFRAYTGGVIDGDECGTELDHGVLVVGFDEEERAWIVKNSWGSNWGEEGYVRIRQAEGLGVCGINQENSQAVYDDTEYRS